MPISVKISSDTKCHSVQNATIQSLNFKLISSVLAFDFVAPREYFRFISNQYFSTNVTIQGALVLFQGRIVDGDEEGGEKLREAKKMKKSRKNKKKQEKKKKRWQTKFAKSRSSMR